VFVPEQAALLVLDLQEYFLSESSHAFVPSAPAILPGVQALISTFGVCRRPVIFTSHENTLDDARQMGTWWRDLLAPDSSAAHIAGGLDVSVGNVLKKHQYDAFHETELKTLLLTQHISQVVITGVMTHLCCETTARSAFMHGFEVFFCVDGTATYTEEFHRSTLLNLAHGFAVPVLVDEILAGFKDCRE
jgi:isochorismate hydrolase